MASPGSRGGLITALVIFVVLFFVAGIFAVVKGTDAAKLQKSVDDLKKKYADAVTDRDMADPAYLELKELKSSPDNRGRSTFDLLREQRDTAVKNLTGAPPAAGDPVGTTAMQTAIASANEKLKDAGIKVPEGAALAAVGALTEAVAQKQADVAKLTSQLGQANDRLKAASDTYNAELTKLRETLENARTEGSRQIASSEEYRNARNTDLQKLQQEWQASIEQNRKALDDLNTQLTAKNQEVANLQKKLNEAILALDRTRPKNITDAMMRRADGAIVNVGTNGVVYIDLGTGDQISPGMTFQIYDKNEGIPKGSTVETEEGEIELPPGKGSLEVMRVQPGSSQCRIIKTQPGARVQTGDLVANLIYDKNTKLAFKVYGQFDTDQNNVPTDNEAEVIKRLINQWGGKVTEDLSVSTDFVVLGAEPKVPEKPADETNPIDIFRWQQAMKASQAYEDVRNKAIEMHIPILNQNRFLYMIGFYDQGQRLFAEVQRQQR